MTLLVGWLVCCVVRQFISFIGTFDDTMTTRRMIGMKSIGSCFQRNPQRWIWNSFSFSLDSLTTFLLSLSPTAILSVNIVFIWLELICAQTQSHTHICTHHSSYLPSASRPQPTNQQTKRIKTKTQKTKFILNFFSVFSVSSFRISGTSTRTHYTTISIFTVLRILTIAFASSLHFSFFFVDFCVFFSSFSFYFFFFFVHFYFVSFLSFHFVHGRE